MADGTIRIDTEIDKAGFKSSLSSMGQNISSFTGKASSAFSGLADIMMGPVAAGKAIVQTIGSVIKVMSDLEKEYQAAARAEAILNSTLKATGAGAWTSAKQIYEYADAMEVATGMNGDAIVSMQSVLLGFKNIKGDNFKEASTQIMNMATVMKMDLSSAAQAVGKALDDPINGIDSLSRQGFKFSDQQKKMLKDMVEAGDIAKAQKIILDELNTTYGGAAEAAGKATTGAAAYAKATGDLKEEIGRQINETSEPLKSWFATIVQGYADAKKAQNDYRAASKATDAGTATFDQRIFMLQEEIKYGDELLKQYGATRETAKSSSNDIVKSILEQIKTNEQRIAGIQRAKQMQELADRTKSEADQKAAEAAARQVKIEEEYQAMRKKILATLDGEKTEYQKLQEQIDLYNTVRWEGGTQAEKDRIAAIDILIEKQKELTRAKGFENPFTFTPTADFASIDIFGNFKDLKGSGEEITGFFGSLFEDGGEEAARKFIEALKKIIKEDTNSVTVQIKKLVSNIASAFQKSVAIARSVFSALSSIIKIDPAALIKSLGEAITTIEKFFTSTLGSLPYYADAALTMIENLVQGLMDNLPAIKETATNVVKYLATQLAERGPDIVSGAISILLALAMAIIDNLPTIVQAALNIGLSVLTGILNALPQIITGIANALPGIVDAFVDVIPQIIVALIKAIPSILVAILKMVTQIQIALLAAPYQIVIELIKELPSILGALWSAIVSFFTEGIPDLYNSFVTYGGNIISGLIKGIVDAGASIWNAIVGVFNAVVKWFCDFFGTHSPSTLFFDFGIFLIQGLINGIIYLGSTIWNSIVWIFTSLVKNIQDVFANIPVAFNSIVDSLKNAFTWQNVSSVILTLIGNILGLVNSVKTTVGSIFSTLVSVFSWESIAAVFSSLYANVTKVFSDIGNVIGMLANVLKIVFEWSGLSGIFENLKNNAIGIFTKIGDAIKSAGSFISSVFSWSNFTSIFNTLSTNIQGIFNGMFNGIKSLWDGLVSVLKSPFNAVISGVRAVIDTINKISVDLPFGGGHIGFNIPKPDFLATGTSNFKGGQAYINDQNAGVNGAELVTLPNGSKVATATATEGLLNQGVMSIMQKLSGMLAPSMDSVGMDRTITLINKNDNRFYADGRQLAQVMIENIDKVAIN